MFKSSQHKNAFTVDELDAISAALLKNKEMEAKKEESEAKSKAAQSATNKMVSQVLTQLLSAITEDPTVEKTGDELANALDTNDAGKFTQTLQPILVKASQAALTLQQLKANAMAAQQAQQQQEALDPRGLAAYNAFMQYHNRKPAQQSSNQPASTVSSTPQFYQQAATANPLVNASVGAQALAQAQAQAQQQVYQPQSSFTRWLPHHPQYSPQFDLYGNKNFGDGFIPNQTWNNQGFIREFCSGPQQQAQMQQPVDAEAMVGESMMMPSGKRARME